MNRARSLFGGVAALLLSVGADALPFTLETAALRAELSLRRAAYTGTLDRRQRRQVEALEQADGYLRAPSASLAVDLRNFGSAAKPLERAFPGDGTLEGLLRDVADGGATLVREQRDALAGLIAGWPAGRSADAAAAALATADRRLRAAGRESASSRRARLLQEAMEQVVRGNLLLVDPTPGRGDPPPPPEGGCLPGVRASAHLLVTDAWRPGWSEDGTWTADAASATVVVDEGGRPVGLEFVLTRRIGDAIRDRLTVTVDAGFTGVGTWQAFARYEPGDGTWAATPAFPGEPPTITVTAFDLSARRLEGTFQAHLYNGISYPHADCRFTQGTFEACGFTVRSR